MRHTNDLEKINNLQIKGNPNPLAFEKSLQENIVPQPLVESAKNVWQWFIYSMKNAFDFKGRATRAEYFSFSAIFMLLLILLMIIPYAIIGLPFVFLLLIVPVLSVHVRRFHDIGYSAWIGLVPLYGVILLSCVVYFIPDLQQDMTYLSYGINILFFILACLPSVQNTNKYGDCKVYQQMSMKSILFIIIFAFCLTPFYYFYSDKITADIQDIKVAKEKIAITPNQALDTIKEYGQHAAIENYLGTTNPTLLTINLANASFSYVDKGDVINLVGAGFDNKLCRAMQKLDENVQCERYKLTYIFDKKSVPADIMQNAEIFLGITQYGSTVLLQKLLYAIAPTDKPEQSLEILSKIKIPSSIEMTHMIKNNGVEVIIKGMDLNMQKTFIEYSETGTCANNICHLLFNDSLIDADTREATTLLLAMSQYGANAYQETLVDTVFYHKTPNKYKQESPHQSKTALSTISMPKNVDIQHINKEKSVYIIAKGVPDLVCNQADLLDEAAICKNSTLLLNIDKSLFDDNALLADYLAQLAAKYASGIAVERMISKVSSPDLFLQLNTPDMQKSDFVLSKLSVPEGITITHKIKNDVIIVYVSGIDNPICAAVNDTLSHYDMHCEKGTMIFDTTQFFSQPAMIDSMNQLNQKLGITN